MTLASQPEQRRDTLAWQGESLGQDKKKPDGSDRRAQDFQDWANNELSGGLFSLFLLTAQQAPAEQ